MLIHISTFLGISLLFVTHSTWVRRRRWYFSRFFFRGWSQTRNKSGNFRRRGKKIHRKLRRMKEEDKWWCSYFCCFFCVGDFFLNAHRMKVKTGTSKKQQAAEREARRRKWKKRRSTNALKTVFINFNFCLYYASVVLLDTTKEATLEWTRYPYGPQAQTPGVSSINFFTLFSVSFFPSPPTVVGAFSLQQPDGFDSCNLFSSSYSPFFPPFSPPKMCSLSNANQPCRRSGWRSRSPTTERASIGAAMLCAMLHIKM